MIELIHHDARRELADAVAWYEYRRTGLGLEFLAQVRQTAGVLLLHPRRAAEIGRGVRKANLKRFPYSIIYQIVDDRIFIVAVAHQSRRTRYWRGRLN